MRNLIARDNDIAGSGARRRRFFLAALLLIAPLIVVFILLQVFSTTAVRAEDAALVAYPPDAYKWIKHVSSTSAGNPAANGSSISPSISSHGRYVAFSSGASNLVPGDTNGKFDIFLKDTQTGAIQRVSTAADGTQSNDASYSPTISADGHYIAFASSATNLVEGDTNNVMDVFVKDAQTGDIQLVSCAVDGSIGAAGSKNPSISADGRYVAFESDARNLLGSWDSDSQYTDVFVKDTQTGAIYVASTKADGKPGYHESRNPSISTDGRFVTFESRAYLAPGDSSGQTDIILKDSQTGEVQLINKSAHGVQSNSAAYRPSISDDGRFIAFYSLANNITSNDTNNHIDIFIKNTQTGAIELASITAAGVQGNNGSTDPSISADGRYVAFISRASNLVPGDSGILDIFIKDTQTGAIRLLSTAGNATQGDKQSSHPSISADGSLVAFQSDASNLVNQEVDGSNSHIYLTNVSSIHDTSPPQITNVQPTGRIAGNDFTIEADYSDSETGIDPATVTLWIMNKGVPQDVTADANITDSHISYSGKAYGLVTVALLVKDHAGNEAVTSWDFDAPETCYFPWYDARGGQTWVLVAQPSAGSPAATGNVFDIFLRDVDESDIQLMSDDVAVGQGKTSYHYYAGKMGGPVKVELEGEGLVSERSLFGSSFEELWAVSYGELDSHYWWPVYDSAGPMLDWIMVANPPENDETVRARVNIYKHGSVAISEERDIEPGDSWTPIYPGETGGPVEVTAWRAGSGPGNPDDARKVIATQRVLYNGAFNEMPGMSASGLDSMYIWTWYDQASPGASNQIFIGNPNDYSVFAYAIIGDPTDPLHIDGAWLAPKQHMAIQHDIMGGPVIAAACRDSNCKTPAPIVASQRQLWGPSFGEIAGTPLFTAVYTTANWTWYDQKSPGAANWVLVSNLSDTPVYAEVRIAGAVKWSGTIAAFKNRTPAFPGDMGGPVEVEAWTDASKAEPAPIFASQRVLWNGYFSEIVGKGL